MSAQHFYPPTATSIVAYPAFECLIYPVPLHYCHSFDESVCARIEKIVNAASPATVRKRSIFLIYPPTANQDLNCTSLLVIIIIPNVVIFDL